MWANKKLHPCTIMRFNNWHIPQLQNVFLYNTPVSKKCWYFYVSPNYNDKMTQLFLTWIPSIISIEWPDYSGCDMWHDLQFFGNKIFLLSLTFIGTHFTIQHIQGALVYVYIHPSTWMYRNNVLSCCATLDSAQVLNFVNQIQTKLIHNCAFRINHRSK